MRRNMIGSFKATSGRRPAYYTEGGRHWIHKTGSRWHLLQMGHPGEGRERETLGHFTTLTAAVNYYMTNIHNRIDT